MNSSIKRGNASSNTRYEEGTILDDRFSIGGILGVGGFSEVYNGTQINIGRPVAIKILGMDRSSPEESRTRFYREAKIAAELAHPGVVEVYDFGETDKGDFYIVLELMEGDALDIHLTQNGPIKVPRAGRLMMSALRALGAAHKRNIIHRDLKPANLFLDHPHPDTELLRILDFGIAFIVEDPASRLTMTGEMIGTPQYMAPEYMIRQDISPALDVYQMGLIFVEMLIGRRLLPRNNVLECYKAHTQGELNIPDWIWESPLHEVISKSLAVDPKDRYPNAGKMRRGLEVALEDIIFLDWSP